MLWMLLVLLYGLLKGAREIAKKKAMEKNTVMEVLIVYTLLSFVLVIPQAPNATGLSLKFYLLIALKSFSIFLAWIFSFHSLKKLPVSVYGVLDLSRLLFATSLGIFVLKETVTPLQIIGLLIVCLGLFLSHCLKPATIDNNKSSYNFYIFLALLSCLLNAVSGFLDKVVMAHISSSQLQFWYMLFLVLYYLIYVLIRKIKISLSVFKNIWVWILAIMFVIGDKALFIANADPASKITVMTVIKQSGCLVTILGGKFIFKEKNTGYRLLCALVVIFGIIVYLIV